MKRQFQTIYEAFTRLAYPPLCLHCRISIQGDVRLLCPACAGLLELIDLKERCPYCCSLHFCQKRGICGDCVKRNPILNGLTAAFDYLGPAATLIKRIKYSNQPYLAEGCGAFLAAQFLETGWPMPDIIIPVPIAFNHWVARGYNQSQLLAESVAKMLDKPVCDLLKRKSGDFSQAGLGKQQRAQLDGKSFFLKTSKQLQDKRILLIDDVITTGSTMHRCAEALLEGLPSSIYGLALCKAV